MNNNQTSYMKTLKYQKEFESELDEMYPKIKIRDTYYLPSEVLKEINLKLYMETYYDFINSYVLIKTERCPSG